MIFSTNSDVLFIEGRRRNSAQENWKSCVNKNKAKNHMPTLKANDKICSNTHPALAESQ